MSGRSPPTPPGLFAAGVKKTQFFGFFGPEEEPFWVGRNGPKIAIFGLWRTGALKAYQRPLGREDGRMGHTNDEVLLQDTRGLPGLCVHAQTDLAAGCDDPSLAARTALLERSNATKFPPMIEWRGCSSVIALMTRRV